MPLVLSHRHAFRGIFSQREILCDVIKTILECEDDSYENLLLIKCNSGQIKFEREDGTVDRFCKFNYPALCRELKLQSRVAIFDSSGEEDLFAIWLTPINEVYYSPSEKKSRSGIDVNESEGQLADEDRQSQIKIEQPAIPTSSRIFGEGPKMPDKPLDSANLSATVGVVTVTHQG